MKTATGVIEIDKAIVPALRVSETLPCDLENGSGNLRVLQDEARQAVGFLVEKTDPGDAWDSLDPRYFITPSFREAVDLLTAGFPDLPPREW